MFNINELLFCTTHPLPNFWEHLPKKTAKKQFFSILQVSFRTPLPHRLRRRTRREQKRCRRVKLFLDQFPAEQVVPGRIGRALEFLENREMRRGFPNRLTGAFAVFHQDKLADEGTGVFAESALPIGRPEIQGGSKRFFRAVIEIVAEGRADLAFQLHRRHQPSFPHHQQVPELGGPKVPRQGEHPAMEADFRVFQSVPPHDVLNQGQESIHVFPASYSGPLPLVERAAFDLLLPGGFAASPKPLHGLLCLALVAGDINTHNATCSMIIPHHGFPLLRRQPV